MMKMLSGDQGKDLSKKHSVTADAEILQGGFDRLLRSVEDLDEPRRYHDHGDGSDNTDREGEREGHSDALAGVAFVISSVILSDEDGGSGGQAHDERHDKVHDFATVGDCGDTGFAASELADDPEVNGAVECLEKVGGEEGQTENQEIFQNISAGEILLSQQIVFCGIAHFFR